MNSSEENVSGMVEKRIYRSRLEGERVCLRKARKSDLDQIYSRVWGDADLLANTFLTVSESYESAQSRMDRAIQFQSEKPVYFLVLKDTDEVIGLGGMMEESPGIWSEATLVVGREWQGKGYGKEMLGLLLAYAFDELGAREFAYYAMTHNEASKALAIKMDFSYCSSTEECRRNGEPVLVERFLLSSETYHLNRNKTEETTFSTK